ncbi:ABC transporter permease [Psychromarinibacter sp. C21-152]|uniref:ABC transporter permease n=1 Tax=Psychromarinibacter sediminicola TaxID=3033385 RepID=A0AAE3NT32_9RHOB|nr:ABC transporter permease [Psychromarinibacter sediminicola]MDF0600420.1 ABC transporter permease [Psychromarinibacter sediminicola]
MGQYSTDDVAPRELGHDPDDPALAEMEDDGTEADGRLMGLERAGAWRLAWWKFKRHKLAVASGILVLLIYFVAAFAEFLAPAAPGDYAARYTYAPPQTLRIWDGEEFGLHVTGYKVEVNPESLAREFVNDPEQKIPVGFFVRGSSYEFWGLFEWDRHLFGPLDPDQPMYLLGADRLGRDMLSRIIYGTRISMTVGLVGVALSLFFGILLGGLSGYYGGHVDNVIQRIIEFLLAIPTIPLWMGLAAAIPPTLPPVQVYFMITIILSLVGWTGLARVVRGRFLAMRNEDFVTAARLDGASEVGLILRHMLPSFASHIIAAVTLAIPVMILSETALSFLGIGLRPPVVSWGVLLQEAQNIRTVATAPWLLLPGMAVVITVLALNFLGDGLRDAADPYSK